MPNKAASALSYCFLSFGDTALQCIDLPEIIEATQIKNKQVSFNLPLSEDVLKQIF